ncbi:MAG TPA: DUF1446 domain-containing protein [Parachlamydiaceae bacterium]|nr:DUF1446 domain-containing protein [Parachlamydiaceae bacterium]
MKKAVKIGNSQGFWGDGQDASFELLNEQKDLDYLTLDYLAEVSLSIMAIQKEKDLKLGYAKDFLDTVKSLIPLWKEGSRCKVITNAGGLNPLECAKECTKILKEAGLPLSVAAVFGDDVLPLILKDVKNSQFNNLDSGKPIEKVTSSLVSANAYLGAKSIVEALSKGADIVVTGRVADPSLTVAAAAFYWNWKFDQYDLLAGATVAGHLIECGRQVTGGILTDWLKLKDPFNIGFPIAEIFEDGSFVITKPKNTGGAVTEQSVKEQLLYEIGDPANYLSPDVTVSFLNLKVKDEGQDRVHVEGAKGSLPPKTLKVSTCYRDGFKAEGMLTIFGEEAVKKAKLCGQIILDRVKRSGFHLEKTNIEALGSLEVVPEIFKQDLSLKECVLRVAVKSPDFKAVSCFAKEIAPLVTSGPQGVVGYTSGRPSIREVFGFWPCLIDALQVHPHVELIK